jgi:hypothetical protein
MYESTRKRILKALFSCVSIGIILSVLQAAPEDKLTPAALVAKHLESIGSAEARAKVRGTRIKGTAMVTVKLCGEGQVEGEVLISSSGKMNLIDMEFNTAGYPYERLRFDGKNFGASHFKTGSRTCLAQFFVSNDNIFKEGLVGGTLSESWPLLNLEDKNPKLEYGGLKKIDGKELHVLKYSPRKGSDLKIVLFFERDTFRHVRTEYSRVIYAMEQRRIGGGGGSMPQAQSQQASNARIDAYEEFLDFKEEAGLNLPHTYKFHLSFQSEVRPALVDWTFNLNQFEFNASLEPAAFTIGHEQKN